MSIFYVPWLCFHICEAACHFETCDSETCCVSDCMCMTRRLVATGGGNQADLYSFDHPGVRGWAGCVSKNVREGEIEGENGVYPSKRCILLGQYA